MHVPVQHVARRLGCTHRRQVRHVERTGRFLEQPHLSVTLGRWCVCLSTNVCQLPSACRGIGVYSSSLLILGLTRFPVAPGPANRARHGTRQKRSPTRLRLGHQVLAFVQKPKPCYCFFGKLFHLQRYLISSGICKDSIKQYNKRGVGFMLSGQNTNYSIKWSVWNLLWKCNLQVMNCTLWGLRNTTVKHL